MSFVLPLSFLLLLQLSLTRCLLFSPAVLRDKWISDGEWSLLEFSDETFTAKIDGTSVEGTYWIETTEYPFVLALQATYPFFIYMECLYRVDVNIEGLKTLYVQPPSDPLAILTGTAKRPSKFDKDQQVLYGSIPEPFLDHYQGTILGEWETDQNLSLSFFERGEFKYQTSEVEFYGSFRGTVNQTGVLTLTPNLPLGSILDATFVIHTDSRGREMLQVTFSEEILKERLFQNQSQITFRRTKPLTRAFDVDYELTGKWIWSNTTDWIEFYETGFWISSSQGSEQQGSFYTEHDRQQIVLQDFNSNQQLIIQYRIELKTENRILFFTCNNTVGLNRICQTTVSQLVSSPTKNRDPMTVGYWMNDQDYFNLYLDGSFELMMEDSLFQGFYEISSQVEPKQIILRTSDPQQREIRGIYEVILDSNDYKWLNLQLPSLDNILSGNPDKPTIFSEKIVLVFWEWVQPSDLDLNFDPFLVNRWMNLQSSLEISPIGHFSLSTQGVFYKGRYTTQFVDPQVLVLDFESPTDFQLQFVYQVQKDIHENIFLQLRVLESEPDLNVFKHLNILFWEKTPNPILETEPSLSSTKIPTEVDLQVLSQKNQISQSLASVDSNQSHKQASKCSRCTRKCRKACQKRSAKKDCLDKCQSCRC